MNRSWKHEHFLLVSSVNFFIWNLRNYPIPLSRNIFVLARQLNSQNMFFNELYVPKVLNSLVSCAWFVFKGLHLPVISQFVNWSICRIICHILVHGIQRYVVPSSFKERPYNIFSGLPYSNARRLETHCSNLAGYFEDIIRYFAGFLPLLPLVLNKILTYAIFYFQSFNRLFDICSESWKLFGLNGIA